MRLWGQSWSIKMRNAQKMISNFRIIVVISLK